MMKKLFLIPLILATFLLSGCLTTLLWKGMPTPSDKYKNKENQIISTDTDYQFIGEDKLKTFGKTKDEKQLIMLGEKYWYLFDAKSSQELSGILSMKLSKPFIRKEEKSKVIISDDGKTFSSAVELKYPVINQQEHTQLVNQGFMRSPENLDYIFKKFELKGNIYQSSPELKIPNPFNPPLPIALYQTKNETNFNAGLLLKKIAMTPVALVGDVLFLPWYAGHAVSQIVK